MHSMISACLTLSRMTSVLCSRRWRLDTGSKKDRTSHFTVSKAWKRSMVRNSKLLCQVRCLNLNNQREKTDLLLLPGPFTFTIGDTTKFGAYEGGGTVTEVKKPEIINFVRRKVLLTCSWSSSVLSLETLFRIVGWTWNVNLWFLENVHARQSPSRISSSGPISIALPGIAQTMGWSKCSLVEILPLSSLRGCFQADAEKFFELVEKLNTLNKEKPVTDELNKHWIKLFSKICTGDVCPVQAVIGGIAAQEVMKVKTERRSVLCDDRCWL